MDVDEDSDQKLDLYPRWIYQYGLSIEAIYAYAISAKPCALANMYSQKKIFAIYIKKIRFICKIKVHIYSQLNTYLQNKIINLAN